MALTSKQHAAIWAAHRYCKGTTKSFKPYRDRHKDFAVEVVVIFGHRTILITFFDTDLLEEIRKIARGWDCDIRVVNTTAKQVLLTPS